MGRRAEKHYTLELVLNNMVNHEKDAYSNQMDSFINQNKPTTLENYMAIYHEIDRLSALCVKRLYDKIHVFPFRRNSEIKMVERSATKAYIDFYKTYAKYIPTSQEIDEKLLSRQNKLAETEIYIGDAILKDKLKNEKQKYRPVALSGLWGIVGSLLGGLLGAWASLYASGMTTWPFR